MLEDNRLKIFMTVASLGSFTAAARQLDITQPSVSQNIAELERQVGATLFERSRAAVKLTPQGETFKLFAARIIRNYEDLNAVFADYEAFKSMSERVNELTSDPLYDVFKEVLPR